MRVSPDAMRQLAALPQCHGIPDRTLILLAERRTRLQVRDRWVAIALILSNRIPIPVVMPKGGTHENVQ